LAAEAHAQVAAAPEHLKHPREGGGACALPVVQRWGSRSLHTWIRMLYLNLNRFALEQGMGP
jgi:hypothetical protein